MANGNASSPVWFDWWRWDEVSWKTSRDECFWHAVEGMAKTWWTLEGATNITHKIQLCVKRIRSKVNLSYLCRFPNSRCTFLLGLGDSCLSVCVMDVCDCLSPLDSTLLSQERPTTSSGSTPHAPCELWLVGGGKGEGLRDIEVGNIHRCEAGEETESQSHLESVCACASTTLGLGLVFSRDE